MKNKKQSGQPRRYDVNQTLSSSYTYQPGELKQSHNQPVDAVTESQTPKTKRKWFGWKRAILLLFVIILAPLLIIGIWDLRNAADASEKLFGTRNVSGAFLPTGLKSEANRTNILLIGYSEDDPGHAGALLTDSIMVVSLDKTDKTGYMLSVPRDLYVDIPDYGSAKINEAYQAGEQQKFNEDGFALGGAGMLQKVVSSNFGIPLDYYVIVNYGAVKGITDALGGITVDIKSTDERGLYDPNFKPQEGGPLKLANGPQEIDGATALRLTRARGSTYGSYGFPQSDFNRTQNQQLVFAAIKKEMKPGLLADPRVNKPVFDALASNLKTDLKLSEVLPLYRLFNSVPDASLQQINLRDVNKVNYLASYQTRSGQSALIPAAGVDDFSEIQGLLKQLNN